jgi:hypothetical protein
MCGVGGLSAPCSRPHPPLGGGGNIKLQVLHLSGNAVAVKGREPCCPIPSAASQLLLASRDAGAHTASRETLWGGYTQPGIAMWLPGWPLKEWCRWFSAMPVHGYSATCANHVRSSQGPLMASQMAGGGSGTDNHTPEAMPRETQKSRLQRPWERATGGSGPPKHLQLLVRNQTPPGSRPRPTPLSGPLGPRPQDGILQSHGTDPTLLLGVGWESCLASHRAPW